jgi:prepilin-type N-terminal cleavage/methylation domain-containing protein
MNIKLKKQKGFTLIELLVAIAIFAIFILTLTSSYIDIARKQGAANEIRGIYSEIRYVFNILSEEIKSKTVDYACYKSTTKIIGTEEEENIQANLRFSNACNEVKSNPAGTYLALIDSSGNNRTIFRVVEASFYDIEDYKILQFYKERFTGRTWEAEQGFSDYKDIDLKNVNIKGLNFDIAPLADPFNPDNIACGPVQFQPSVTINTTIEGDPGQTQTFSMDLQTTVSSRIYNRQTNL